jgi:hypothetical protein
MQNLSRRFAVIFLIAVVCVPYYRETFATPEEAFAVALEFGNPGSVLTTVTEEGSTLDVQLSALIVTGEKISA